MKIPRLVWNRRHNVAALTVSFGKRVWRTREVGDLILGYNAAGRLSRVVMLDPRTLLPPAATETEALALVTQSLLRAGQITQPDLDVLRSALDRSRAQTWNGSGAEDPSPWPPEPDRAPDRRSRGAGAAP
jgi:hypothetical protein